MANFAKNKNQIFESVEYILLLTYKKLAPILDMQMRNSNEYLTPVSKKK